MLRCRCEWDLECRTWTSAWLGAQCSRKWIAHAHASRFLFCIVLTSTQSYGAVNEDLKSACWRLIQSSRLNVLWSVAIKWSIRWLFRTHIGIILGQIWRKRKKSEKSSLGDFSASLGRLLSKHNAPAVILLGVHYPPPPPHTHLA